MRRYPSLLVAVLVVLSIVVVSLVPAGTATGQAPVPTEGSALSAAQAAGVVFLPMSMRDYPRLPTTLGLQMHSISAGNGFSLAAQTSAYWVRYNAFDWNAIEPRRTDPPTYLWSAVYEASLINAAHAGMQVIATVKFTPSWARKVSSSSCSAVRADAFDEYAQFLTALVRRYSAAPYNVRYWELGNEVDVDPSEVPSNSGFGCWGDINDYYYGGGFYAEMLKVAYPAIKAADPRAQVMLGGLLMDCDPTQSAGQRCERSRFLEGVLRAGGAPYFDILSFHGYVLFNGTLRLDIQHPGWVARGGAVLGKIDFLREVLRNYGVSKPIMDTEGALVCDPYNYSACRPVGTAFYEAQADYVVWLYVRNWAEGLVGTVWYDFQDGGWRYSGLLDANGTPRPAYFAFKFLGEELRGATYRGRVDQYSGVAGYAFTQPGKRIWVLWTPDEVARTIALPAETLRVLDKYGNVIATGAGALSLKSPVYVELTP